MTCVNLVTTERSRRACSGGPADGATDDTDPAGYRALYVLCLGIAGAVISNALVFVYFASFYVQG